MYGDGLAKVVLDFQKKNKLGADEVAGRVTMAANEKVLTSLITPPKEEEIKVPNLYNPESKAVIELTARVLSRLEKQETNPISDVHRKNLESGTLTDSQAIGILFVAIDREFLTKN
ncbi:hypothetical protein [Sporosarcina limicola]|uniref:Peptidoglycan binding-like domain-containing protein n=1 Tax=Sporosarcina limicola TaxID=34101 RepID=A0A927R7U8_9BACL|nr:hypothetical protein [Sporosarcina limicola]MBE1556349.1 hypothetical protein [Sporosarcina limicola]